MSAQGTSAERVRGEGQLRAILEECYREAEEIVRHGNRADLDSKLGDLAASVHELGALEHAAAGVALTLAAFKAYNPDQDVTAHKDEHEGGFSARRYDTNVTVPYLLENGLPRNVETHWLSQTFSFSAEFRPGLVLKTVPKRAGPLMIEVISRVQTEGAALARAVVTAILLEKIEIRNKGRVTLTLPKNLSIEATVHLIGCHLDKVYQRNAPRLPQIVIYAVYECLLAHIGRYKSAKLAPLERMKSADRKANTIGDVVVNENDRPIEAIEIKYGQPIRLVHVSEAIEKVRALSVTRYYMLSTNDVDEGDWPKIVETKDAFLKQNGCEIIINGVLPTLNYYLRLLPDTAEFITNYVAILNEDEDVGYEHRVAWNECCKGL